MLSYCEFAHSTKIFTRSGLVEFERLRDDSDLSFQSYALPLTCSSHYRRLLLPNYLKDSFYLEIKFFLKDNHLNLVRQELVYQTYSSKQ